jgi:hypothetical protein
MTERSSTSYARLIDVRILHHYWLDQGETEFGAIADDGLARRRLLTYDVRRILRVVPSEATATLVSGLGGVFRTTGLGFVVGVPDDVIVPPDVEFEFYVAAATGDYADYTALSLRPRDVVDVVDPADGTVRRYKANVAVVSNATGASRGTGASRRLFLSTEYVGGASNGDAVEALVTSGASVRQLLADPPGAVLRTLGSRNALPVYVHQGDIPPITPPAGSVGAPQRGIELAPHLPRDVEMVVRIVRRHDSDPAFSIVNADGTVRSSTRPFEIHLRNRWTTRRYRHRSDGSIQSTDAEPTPLTYFDNAGPRRPPAPEALDVERDTSNPPRITRLISDVYV